MKKLFLTTALLSLLVGATAISSMASSAPCSMSQMRGGETGHMMGSGMMGSGMMGSGMMGSGMMGSGMMGSGMMGSGTVSYTHLTLPTITE